jgi:hypothetical protein
MQLPDWDPHPVTGCGTPPPGTRTPDGWAPAWSSHHPVGLTVRRRQDRRECSRRRRPSVAPPAGPGYPPV